MTEVVFFPDIPDAVKVFSLLDFPDLSNLRCSAHLDVQLLQRRPLAASLWNEMQVRNVDRFKVYADDKFCAVIRGSS